MGRMRHPRVWFALFGLSALAGCEEGVRVSWGGLEARY